MEPDLLDCYARASEWTLSKVPAAAQKMDARTPCDEWDVRMLMNHMLDTEGYFVGSAWGEDVSPPSPNGRPKCPIGVVHPWYIDNAKGPSRSFQEGPLSWSYVGGGGRI